MVRSTTGKPGREVKTARTRLAWLGLRIALGAAGAGWFLVGGAEAGVAQGTGTIVGRVVGAANGEPIASVQVSVAGLQVLSGGGQAGAGKVLRLRGINSLLSEEPVVFLDGIRLGRIGRASPRQTGQIISYLDMLTPQDVARIDIRKGSASAALYGSDGIGGVILIYPR